MRPIDADALLREVDDMWRRADENERFREAEVLGWLHQLIQSADTVEDVEMSDEELASLLQPICPPIPHCPDEPPHNCRKCVFNWLRQEATP